MSPLTNKINRRTKDDTKPRFMLSFTGGFCLSGL